MVWGLGEQERFGGFGTTLKSFDQPCVPATSICSTSLTGKMCMVRRADIVAVQPDQHECEVCLARQFV